MKILTVAAVAFLALPLPAAAETWWLIIAGHGYQSSALQTVPTSSEEECEAAGKKLYDSRELKAPYNIHSNSVFDSLRYSCVKGK